MQTRERAHFARSVFPFIKKKKNCPDRDVCFEQPTMGEAVGGSDVATSETPDGLCPKCWATFSGYQGMRNHMRRAHPEVFHSAVISYLESLIN